MNINATVVGNPSISKDHGCAPGYCNFTAWSQFVLEQLLAVEPDSRVAVSVTVGALEC